MKKLLAGTALAIVAFASTPAAAQAVQGFRVEAHAGADILRAKIEGVSTPTVKLDDTGILYGLGLGYDFAVSEGVSIGIDLDLDRSTAKLEKTFLDGFGAGLNEEVTIKPRWDGFIGARVSFPVSDTSNFYLKGGYARGYFTGRIRERDADTDAVLFSESERDHLGGWRVGAGAQVALMRNAYVGGEVRYTDYKQDVSRIQALLTLGLRFGAAPVEAVVVEPAPAPLPAPEPAPATQTCADGSVILATDACPAPPMPTPAPERG